MSKIISYIKRIANMDFKQMWKISKEISKKTKRLTLTIIIDMTYCSVAYSAGYMDYHEYEFYNMNKQMRKTYVTTGINHRLVTRFNKKEEKYKFQDKIVFNKIFNKYLGREWLYLKESNLKEFQKFLKNKTKIIVKPNEDYAGNGIEVIDIADKTNIEELYNRLMKNNQLLVEQVLENHKEIKKIYPKSLNTLRIITFYDGSETHILTTIIKIGNGGVIDNFATGGLYMFLNEKGDIYTDAIDKDGNIVKKHPITNIKFKGITIPLFKEAIELVKEASKEVPDIKFVGWDVAILQDRPIIIEGNQSSGAFQLKASLNKTKEGNLPIYEKAMKIKIYNRR